MKKLLLLLAAVLLATPALLSQVPQFSANDFEGWIYTNPSTELNQSNILRNRIYLYTTSNGLQLTLTSPPFGCVGGQTIDIDVTWITDQWQTSGFNVSKVALTAAILDDDGVARDSVTYTPTSVSRTNQWRLSLPVPRGLRHARLRFASWKADVNSNGAVRQIVMTSTLRGDVNADNEITVADINTIIDLILGDVTDAALMQRADVNHDGEVTLADVNDVIDMMLW